MQWRPEGNRLERLDRVVLVKEQQLDRVGVLGEDREVHAGRVNGRTQWVRRAGLDDAR
jgi:hypothetical protein